MIGNHLNIVMKQSGFLSLVIVICLVAPGTISAQHTRPKNDQAQMPASVEVNVIGKIQGLREIQELIREVARQSNGKRRVIVAIYQRPAATFPYYWVRVWEDNGETNVDRFDFYVSNHDRQVTYFDPENNKQYSLKAWRKLHK